MTSILLLSRENKSKGVNAHLVGIDATGQDIGRTGPMRRNVRSGSDMRQTVGNWFQAQRRDHCYTDVTWQHLPFSFTKMSSTFTLATPANVGVCWAHALDAGCCWSRVVVVAGGGGPWC
ncbi:uncharacterized protein EDB93DRAFT_1107688 [Suillus bovinus]|uniref:uncharacterized protein n=1 Tax=Suillus bovinus TaxID=48563 RepID=UPI001B875598|nr:uncharacterized protein EDB93DRAFT_1107688 [Suillus bovinus]KAG2132887.1 hypothetical protein EDB93DRAFT_1107688 [Suillus bovinus]